MLGYQELFLGMQSSQSVKLIADLNVRPTLRMHGAIPPLYLYFVLACLFLIANV
jgi:hypothetical protein